MKLRIAAVLVVAALSQALAPAVVLGQQSSIDDQPPAKDKKKADDKKSPSVTHHEVAIDGRAIKYTATAGLMDLPDYDGKPKANVFYVSYIKETDAVAAPEGDAPAREGNAPKPAPPRPILFAFNGGPGSSSVWLHLGTIGPRRVNFATPDEKPGEPTIPAPPYSLVDNEFSWLDLADLVFIDPVGTGYSRPVEGESARQFQGLDEDIRWVGDFIRLWTTRNQRWDSPKYLAGESYGTTRAAGLSGYLQETHGMNLSGIVLISTVLNFQTIRFDEGNDTPYWLYVPTYCATAWYHKRLAPDLQADLDKTLAQAQAWASTDYLLALARGDTLPDGERDRIATALARFTGLSKDYVLRSRLRINIGNFCKELLRDQGRTVGRLDSRYKGIDRDGVGDGFDFDPSYAAIQGPFTAALNSYVRGELGYENDNAYEILTGRVNPWSYASANNRYANVAETLRRAMSQNRNLRVLVASGYYDLATPHFAADYTIDHLGLDPTLRGNVTRAYYECGHMMYIRHHDLAKLKRDVAGFFQRP